MPKIETNEDLLDMLVDETIIGAIVEDCGIVEDSKAMNKAIDYIIKSLEAYKV